MAKKLKEKRNTIIITDIPDKLFNTIKRESKQNLRTIGKESLIAIMDKFGEK